MGAPEKQEVAGVTPDDLAAAIAAAPTLEGVRALVRAHRVPVVVPLVEVRSFAQAARLVDAWIDDAGEWRRRALRAEQKLSMAEMRLQLSEWRNECR